MKLEMLENKQQFLEEVAVDTIFRVIGQRGLFYNNSIMKITNIYECPQQGLHWTIDCSRKKSCLSKHVVHYTYIDRYYFGRNYNRCLGDFIRNIERGRLVYIRESIDR